MRKLITLGILAATLAAQADVIVYKVTGTEHDVGNSQDTKSPIKGWIVFDADTGEFQEVLANLRQQTYSVGAYPVTWRNLQGPNGKTGTSFSFCVTNSAGAAFMLAMGYDSSLKITDTRVVTYPKTLSCRTDASTGPQLSGQFIDATYTLIFNASETQSANWFHRTVSSEINSLKLDFIGMQQQ